VRKPILAANWKMHKTTSETEAYLNVLALEIADINSSEIEVVVLPPFTSLAAASETISERAMSIKLGAQNMNAHKQGAYTGEISATMLRDLFVRYVILGHSERRQIFGETDFVIHENLLAAHESGLRPIFCVGETLEERAAGQVEEVLSRQVRAGLQGMEAREIQDTVVAYEPIWAIGTGRTASAQQAQEVHQFIRSEIAAMSSREVADRVIIQYGGSVKVDNVAGLLDEPDIDGALVGGASLDPREFGEMIRVVRAVRV
jgi:triosephosphate isomerase (TIM)